MFFCGDQSFPIPFFLLPLFHLCDGCQQWGLAGLQGLASHGGSFSIYDMAGHSGSLWVSQAPTLLKRGSWLTVMLHLSHATRIIILNENRA